MDHAVPIDHESLSGAERAAQRDARDRAGGSGRSRRCAVPSARSMRAGMRARCSPRNSRSSVVLPLPLAPTSPTRMPGVSVKLRSLKSVRPPMSYATMFEVDQALGLAVGGGEIDIAPSTCGCATASRPARRSVRPALSMRALDLVARALGPRRSHSISRAHAILQRVLALPGRARNSAFFSRKRCNCRVHAEDAVGIDAVQLRRSRWRRFPGSSGRG